MRSSTAWSLVAIAAALLGVTLALPDDGARSRLPGGERMFPGLAASLPGAERVEITHAGSRLVLARAGETWRLPGHGGYPADGTTLHALLAGLGALRLIEPRTAEPAFFPRLGVADPEPSPGATGAPTGIPAGIPTGTPPGTLVRVLAGDGRPLAAVILGHDGPQQPGDGEALYIPEGIPGDMPGDMYVRRPGERRSWLAQPAVAASADWRDWVRRRVIDLRPDDVARIVSRRGDAPPIELVRRDGRLVVTGPASHPPLDPFKVEDMSRALASLDMLDVRPGLAGTGTLLGGATITAISGLAVTAEVSRDGDAVWLSLRAEGTGSAADAAAALQGRLAGWSFRIEPRKAAALVPAMADLAAYAPAAAATAETAAAARR